MIDLAKAAIQTLHDRLAAALIDDYKVERDYNEFYRIIAVYRAGCGVYNSRSLRVGACDEHFKIVFVLDDGQRYNVEVSMLDPDPVEATFDLMIDLLSQDVLLRTVT